MTALATGADPALSLPVLRGFNFVGGTVLTPEFAALGLGLTLYFASQGSGKVLGPVLAALMLVGQAGSALAAELGIQRNTEQIAALETAVIAGLTTEDMAAFSTAQAVAPSQS